jgi:hypothetical protein
MESDINRLTKKQNSDNIFVLTDRYINRRVKTITLKLEMQFDSGRLLLRAVIGAVRH